MLKLFWLCVFSMQSACTGLVPPLECEWAEPIRPQLEDHLSDSTARQILTHNETGARICGWRP